MKSYRDKYNKIDKNYIPFVLNDFGLNEGATLKEYLSKILRIN